MSRTPKSYRLPAVTCTPQEAKIIMEVVSGDGWTIFKPTAFTSRGVNAELVARYTSVHKSDGSLKGSITDTTTGQPVEECAGVYGLTLLDAAARLIGADTREADSKLGRGFRASALCAAITKRVADLLAHPMP